MAATLQCVPFYTDWSSYDRVDVYDDAIMPGSTFELDTILSAPECKVTGPYGFSAPTPISTVDAWGDVVGHCGVTPCTVPQGAVDFEDITAVVEKYKNNPDAPIKSRADLINWNVTDPEPDRFVDFLDITFCVDAFRGFSENPNPYPGPNLDDFDDCPAYLGDCYADIRVDSNNDGQIDDFDDVVEETSTMFLVVNSDDDNLNEIPDMDEAPVVGEDDLAEIQLTAACDDVLPELAWWSLSWDGAAPVRVWFDQEKSTGEVANDIDDNNKYYYWPPPESLWLESLDTFNDTVFTFRFDTGTGESGQVKDTRTGRAINADAIKSASACSGTNRQHVGVAIVEPDISGVWAQIEGDPTIKLCGEPNATSTAASAAWVSVVKLVGTKPMKWAQIGYRRTRFIDGSPAIQVETFAETYAGCTAPTCYNIHTVPYYDLGLPVYKAYLHQLFGPYEGRWVYERDDMWFHEFAHLNWAANEFGTDAAYLAEIFNFQDDVVGTVGNPCTFMNCRYQHDYTYWPSTNFTQGDIVNPVPSQWGTNLKSATEFEVYDQDRLP